MPQSKQVEADPNLIRANMMIILHYQKAVRALIKQSEKINIPASVEDKIAAASLSFIESHPQLPEQLAAQMAVALPQKVIGMIEAHAKQWIAGLNCDSTPLGGGWTARTLDTNTPKTYRISGYR